MEIPNLIDSEISQSPSMHSRPFTHRTSLSLSSGLSSILNEVKAAVEGTLHHRYVPAVGEPGKHDASYATHMPGSSNKPK